MFLPSNFASSEIGFLHRSPFWVSAMHRGLARIGGGDLRLLRLEDNIFRVRVADLSAAARTGRAFCLDIELIDWFT